MRKRCYFISIMCSISLYTWYSYSLFTPVENSVFTPYYQNSLLMIFYLCWDTYHMTLSSNKSILFRKDLLIHHIVSLIVYLSCINITALQMSNVLIMECISLMNYVWRKHNKWLNLYRTACIFLIRIPLSLWFWLYYNPEIYFPYLRPMGILNAHWPPAAEPVEGTNCGALPHKLPVSNDQRSKTIVTDSHHKYLILLGNVYVLFIFYDMYILWQIYKPKPRRLLSAPKI